MTCAEIARELRTYARTVSSIARENGIPVLWRTPRTEAEISRIPKWVPPFLSPDYISDMRLYGEEVAARNARQYKREAASV